MACTPIIFVLALVLTSYSSALTSASKGKIGVDYGLNGDNLLTPGLTVALLASKGVKRVRIYEARPDVILAFANSSINLIIGVPNEEVPKLAANLTEAFNWVTTYVLPFPTSGISSILVGNEWFSNPSNNRSLLVPAMQNIHTALSKLKLFLRKIKVSTAHSFDVLSTPSFPPSIATFAPGVVGEMRPLLDFLVHTRSFFMVNIFPYFSYLNDPGVSLEFALFESTTAVMDPNTGLNYTNLFDLQLDAVYAAIASLLSSSLSPSSSLSSSSCAWNCSEVEKSSNVERVHSEATSQRSPILAAKRVDPKPRPHVKAGEGGWPSGGGSTGTPPGGRHSHNFLSRHSTSATWMSSSSSNTHAHHDHPNHHVGLQNTTITRSATLPSTTPTSFTPSHNTSPLSSSSVSHHLSTHTMPSSSTHAYVTSSSSAPSSSTTSTTSSSSSSTTSSLKSGNINDNSSRTSPSSSIAISNIEESCSLLRTQYTTKEQKVVLGRCACTVENARTFNQNLIRHVLRAKGTPAHPKTPIQAYIFELFNEDLKPPGPEQHYGLFFPNGTAVYPINFHDRGT